MATWKSRFTFTKKSAVEHEVNGNVMRFYPNRLGQLEELAEISKPIAHAIATLIGESRGDATSISESHREKVKKNKDGTETAEFAIDKITVNAVAPDIADHRRRERDTAIDELLDGLTNERNKMMLGKLLMDSLREEFPYKKDRPPAEVEEFLYGKEGDEEGDYQGLDAPMMVQLIQGWLKANSKVFGDVGEKMAVQMKARLAMLQGRLGSEQPMNTADGSSSKTQSSPPSDTDSASQSSSS